MGEKVKGVVLCGGTGSRLRPLTYYFQKAMIPVGSKQKPLLEYIIRLLKYHGISDITLLVNYKAEQIINYFDDGSRFGVKLAYVKDNPNYKGNGGAIYNAYRLGIFNNYEHIVIYYGDILTSLDLSALLRKHVENRATATLALSTNYSVSVGVAEVEGNRIVKLEEKPRLNIPVVIGIAAVRVNVLNYLENLVVELKEVDLMRDFIPLLVSRGYNVEAFFTDAFWYDLGSTERYEKLEPHTVDEILDFLFL
ncbi:MAG: nucleotidyltransferase family protein [Thermofilaceae archaeon]